MLKTTHRALLLGALGALLLHLQGVAADDRAIGAEAFDRACSGCHGDPPVPRALTRAQLAALPPEKIFQAQLSGLMALQAAALTEIEKKAVAIYLSDTEWGTVKMEKAAEKLAMCTGSSAVTAADFERPKWIGWGLDLDNSRFQPGDQAGLTAADLANLELKWVHGYAGATTVTTQPAVVGDHIFIGSPNGAIYNLDRKTGCAYWKYDTAAEVRAAIVVAPRADGTIGLYAGDRKANFYALDANSGKLLWQDRVEPHPWSMITSSPVLYEGKLYFGTASFEELAGGSKKYECCTFRGSVLAYDAESGKKLWQSYVIPGEPQKTKVTTEGVQLWGPSGAAVWSSPTLDPAHNTLYVTTGDSYSAPAADTSDAIVAMDMTTGAIKWFKQMTADDAFTAACVAPNADPVSKEGCGPDVDFGASAILRTLPNGKRLLLAGQKSGVMHAVDPDADGAIVWQKRLSPGGVLGGIEWGFAADDTHLYVPISDVWETKHAPGAAGGIYALNFADGSELWNTPAAKPDCNDIPGCNAGQPAAATLIPGVVFSGSMDGHMRAYDPASGKVIWDVDTKGEHATVNGVPAHGGSIKGAGVTVVNGWVYFGSGYGLFGMPGNMFMAFGPKGD
ncbi:MAG: PQQ-binding-like beta-propeller repeat protein [Gammaproteobacteria bacterium]|nr:PQQ-binding-like beta-propeller repeat protein [Gammaproteobacteria bacterium]